MSFLVAIWLLTKQKCSLICQIQAIIDFLLNFVRLIMNGCFIKKLKDLFEINKGKIL